MRLAFALVLGVVPCLAEKPFSRDLRETSQSLAPYVASPQPIVDRMLEMANIKPGEVVYDLGCGDGRILITAVQKYKAKAVGIELSEKLVRVTNETVKRLNLNEQVEVRHGHLLDASIDNADVVIIYLETGSNDVLRPKLEKSLKTGARVVSHDFAVRGWKPVRVDKMAAFNREHVLYLYEMPQPPVAKPAPKK